MAGWLSRGELGWGKEGGERIPSGGAVSLRTDENLIPTNGTRYRITEHHILLNHLKRRNTGANPSGWGFPNLIGSGLDQSRGNPVCFQAALS